MDNTTTQITVRAFIAVEIAITAERAGDTATLVEAANAAGRQFRTAGIDTDAVAVLAPGLLAPGMGDAWAHLVDAWHGR